MSRPWMKFYPADWRDARLRRCSLSARGLWIDLMTYMHEAEPYGHLLIAGENLSTSNLALQLARPAGEVKKALSELEAHGVFSRTDDGVIYSRRMVRDKAKEETDKANGKRGGNPKITPEDNGGVNPPNKAQKLEARTPEPESNSEAIASDAGASRDIRADLFREGLKALAEMTGKTPDSCRSLVGKWLKSVNDEAIHVLGAIQDAERNRVADPVAWINRALNPHIGDRNGRRTVQDAAKDLHERVLERTKEFLRPGSGDPPSGNPIRLLSQG